MEAPFAGFENLIFLINILFLAIQGIALWRSAKLDQKNWFIIILFFNIFTFGLISIFYLFVFAKKKLGFHKLRGWILKK